MNWQEVLAQLDNWTKNPPFQNEDGYESPTPICLSTTIKLVEEMIAQKLSSPTNVFPTGDGGISLFKDYNGGRIGVEITENGQILILKEGIAQ